MRYMNSQQIMHADVTFILKNEMSNSTFPYIDDVFIKGPKTRYEIDEGYKTIPGNTDIRRFI